ncbi:hypothetical protein JOC94_001867 [Bacillus thermophilus]|uniref:Uncharacterized protein n=1 Tax=Siminovitchia thermophila TaxID=1245522 RepID=A0ABS2R5G3_9BACI|nr:hypothetical protein [Siminovitchia thermophila]ONK21774.1 hypothetical protein BLX87_20015 [Bacillus sp. VT-16-64]
MIGGRRKGRQRGSPLPLPDLKAQYCSWPRQGHANGGFMTRPLWCFPAVVFRGECWEYRPEQFELGQTPVKLYSGWNVGNIGRQTASFKSLE